MDIGLGSVGAVIGGWPFQQIGAVGVIGLNICSLVVAVVGAISGYLSRTAVLDLTAFPFSLCRLPGFDSR